MTKKKLGIVLESGPQIGGCYQYQKTLLHAIRSYLGDYYDISVYTDTKGWIKWCREEKITCYEVYWKLPKLNNIVDWLGARIPCVMKLYYTYFTDIGRKIRSTKPDIMLMSLPTSLGFYGVKSITHCMDLMHRYESRFKEVADEYDYRELLYNCQRLTADIVITDSKLGRKQYMESYCLGKLRRPRVVSLPYISAVSTLTEKEPTGEEVALLPENYVFYPAQFWEHKNHLNLVKAIELLKCDIPDIKLILVGSEKNSKRRVDRYISEHDLSDNVETLGFVSNELLAYMYKHARGMIMPSFFGPTNLPPLEAMAYGCPVAVSNNYAMPEQVGNAGLLFDPNRPEEMADCIRRLWTDDCLRQELSKRGKQRTTRYGEKEFASRLHKIIEM